MRFTYLLPALLWLLPGSEALAHRGHHSKARQKPAVTSKTKKTPVKAGKWHEPPSDAGAVASDSDGGSLRAHDLQPEPEEVEATASNQTSSDAKIGILGLIGRLHPLVVHLPIGWLLLLLFAELGAIVRKGELWPKATMVLLVLTAASIVPGVATGLIRHATHGGDDGEALILLHRNLMFGMAGAVYTALGLRLWRRRPAGLLRLIYLTLIFGAAALMSVGAHLGGKVVYGPDYLPF